MKAITEYINECVEQTIQEGIMNTIKGAIKNLTKTPDKYIDALKKNIESSKQKDLYQLSVKIAKEHKEQFVSELEGLNNDESLDAIYKFIKKLMNSTNFTYFVCGMDKFNPKDSKCYDNINKIRQEVFAKIKKEFDCKDNDIKTYAIFEIAMSFALESYKQELWYQKEFGKSDNGYSNNKSSSSSNVARNTAIAASVMMMKR